MHVVPFTSLTRNKLPPPDSLKYDPTGRSFTGNVSVLLLAIPTPFQNLIQRPIQLVNEHNRSPIRPTISNTVSDLLLQTPCRPGTIITLE